MQHIIARRKNHFKAQLAAAFLYVFVSMSLTTSLISWTLIESWQTEFDAMTAYLLDIRVLVNNDIQDQMGMLAAKYSAQTTCDNTMLQDLRISEHNAVVLRDFGYVRENKLLCNTTAGIFAQPLPQEIDEFKNSLPKPSYHSSAKISPVVADEVGHRLRLGNIQAFLAPMPSQLKPSDWLSVITFSPNDGEPMITSHSALNLPEKMMLKKGESFNELIGTEWSYIHCYAEASCAVMALDLLMFFEQELSVTIAILGVLLIIALMSCLLGWEHAQRYLSLTNQIRRGLNTEQLICSYQPLMDMQNGTLSGCEVLCRWQTTDGEVIFPDTFIPIIEANGQTRELTLLVLEKAIAETTAYQLLGKFRMAINAFPDDVSSSHLLDRMQEIVPPEFHSTITVELTEKETKDIAKVAAGIQRLRAANFKVAIDDFGTGYSNFQHLESLQVDTLKIDKSFVCGLEDHNVRNSIVSHIAEIASSLGIKTVAEGVELEAQFQALKALGVNYSQGYLHAKPMPIAEYAAFVMSCTETARDAA